MSSRRKYFSFFQIHFSGMGQIRAPLGVSAREASPFVVTREAFPRMPSRAHYKRLDLPAGLVMTLVTRV